MKKLTQLKEIRKQVINEIKEFYLEDTIKQYPNLKLCKKRFKHKGFLLKPGHVLLDDNTIAVPNGGAWSYHLYMCCENNKEWIEIFDKNGDQITIHKALNSLCLTIKEAIKEVDKAYIAVKNDMPHRSGPKSNEVVKQYNDYVLFNTFTETALSGLYMIEEKGGTTMCSNDVHCFDKYKHVKFRFVKESGYYLK